MLWIVRFYESGDDFCEYEIDYEVECGEYFVVCEKVGIVVVCCDWCIGIVLVLLCVCELCCVGCG